MVEKKEQDNQQEEIKEPDSENIENEEDNNDTQENTDTEETTEDENSEEDSLEKEIETLKEEKIRLLAEMENLRKRFEREKVDTIKFGSINLARDILSPGDNLERALDALPEDENHPESIKNLIDGLKMVLKEYKSILEKHGVKKIETLNQKFDHNFHQAMMEVENNDVEEGTVVQEVQSGYTMHDRLLRAAMVGVSKKSVAKIEEPKEEKEEKNPEDESKEKS
jgi:molecular chaperone GrpE